MQFFDDSKDYRIAGKFGGGNFDELTHFEHLAKESLADYRSANRLLIVSTNLNGFNLANHGRFAKFTKLSPCQPFPLYGTWPIFRVSHKLADSIAKQSLKFVEK